VVGSGRLLLLWRCTIQRQSLLMLLQERQAWHAHAGAQSREDLAGGRCRSAERPATEQLGWPPLTEQQLLRKQMRRVDASTSMWLQ
jgi:hypothetical protein